MNRETIVQLLDQDIDRLEQAKALLLNSAAMPNGHRLRLIAGGQRKKRILSVEARGRIAAAQRRRWAKQKGLKKAA
jgi:hypothetical protein